MTEKYIKSPFITDEDAQKMLEQAKAKQTAIFMAKMNELNHRFPNEIKAIYSQGWNDAVAKLKSELEANTKKEIEDIKIRSWKMTKKMFLYMTIGYIVGLVGWIMLK